MGPSAYTLDKLGALDSQKVVDGEWWRLFSYMWIHSGLVPLLVSIIRLLIIGVPLEWQFGSAKFGTLYLLSGVGAGLVSCLYYHELSSGASGAIFGLIGGLLSEIITNWTIYENKCSAFLPLIIALVINISVVVSPQADNYAHIGGFIFGFLLGFVFLTRPQPGWTNQKHNLPGHEFTNVKQKYKTYQRVLRFAALFLLIIGYVGCTVKVFYKART